MEGAAAGLSPDEALPADSASEEEEGGGPGAPKRPRLASSAPSRPHTTAAATRSPALPSAPAPSRAAAALSAPPLASSQLALGGGAGPSTSAPASRPSARSFFDDVAQRATGINGGTSFRFSRFRENRDNKAFCERALEKLTRLEQSPAMFVRPGFEEEFTSRVQAYVAGEVTQKGSASEAQASIVAWR